MIGAGLYGVARGALFRLDAERAHELTLAALARAPLAVGLLGARRVADPVSLLGLRFPNRIGLAAGLDKNGDCIAAWNRCGFGFIELGTVTPRPQPGNPRPRMFRLPRQRALINRLGFNNKGVDYLVERVLERPVSDTIVGINIGKNKDTPLDRAAEDYLHCLGKVHGVAGYITVNLSSPNTPGLRELQEESRLRVLLLALRAARVGLEQRDRRRTPLLLKVAPDCSPEQLRHIALAAREFGIDGLVATNTTVTRPGLERVTRAKEEGGLSGAPLKPLADESLRALRAAVGADYPLIGVGGVLAGADARDKRQAGADLVQLYTGFIYRGPKLVADCARAVCRGAR